MLNRVRDTIRGAAAWVVGVLIIIAMAFVGVQGPENFGGSSAVNVDGNKVSARDLEIELRGLLQVAQQDNPDLTREQALAAGLGQRAIEVLVTRALIENEASRLGLAAPDEVVQEYIKQIDGLTDPDTGRVNLDAVQFFIQQRGLTLQGFRDLIAQEIFRNQIGDAITSAAPAPNALTRYLLLRQFEARTVEHASLPLDAAAVEPTEDEIAAFYRQNLDSYLSPEYRTFTVLTITERDVADAIEVPEEDVRQLFEARAGQAAAAEKRGVRQLTVPRGADADAASALKSTGSDLAEIAEALGGEITTLAPQARDGFINDELGDAVFAASEGEVVGPFETPFGTLFAEVASIEAAQGPVFEEERAALEAELRSEIAADRIVELVEAVELVRDGGGTLMEAAAAAGLEARRVGPVDRELFTRTGAIANIPATLGRTGFTLIEGEEGNPPVRLENGYGFITVEDVIEPAPRPLDEVRDEVIRALKAQKRENAAAEISARIEGLIAQGSTFADAVSGLGGTIETTTISVTDEEPDLPRAVLARVFEAEQGAVTAVADPAEPTVTVFRVTGIAIGDTTPMEGAVPVMAQQFGQQLSSELNAAYLQALEEGAEIRQNPREIGRALGQDQQ